MLVYKRVAQKDVPQHCFVLFIRFHLGRISPSIPPKIPMTWIIDSICANYNDFTATSLEIMVYVREIIPKRP